MVDRRDVSGEMLPDFESQVRQTYDNIAKFLKNAGIDLTNLGEKTSYTHMVTI